MEVFRVFGPSAMQAISQNPYLLCGEPLQLDFRHADSIAQYYHMEGDCTQRLEAALLRTLRHNAGNGHTCLPRAQLLDTASHFIQQPPEKLARALDHCIETGQLGVKMLERCRIFICLTCWKQNRPLPTGWPCWRSGRSRRCGTLIKTSRCWS